MNPPGEFTFYPRNNADLPHDAWPGAAPNRTGPAFPRRSRPPDPDRGPDLGTPPAATRILLSPPQLTGGEMAALQATLEAGWVAPAGPVPAAFEAALAQAAGFPHILATTSGTSALHLGYRILGVAPGDEVWTSSLTFVATIAPAVH